MVAFANPVAGLIAAKGAPAAAGQFRVTSTFAEHVASGRGAGIDIGNGGCGAPVIAMKAGTISYIRLGTVGATTSDKASIVRVLHANGYTTGYAHLSIRTGLAVGQVVGVGYQLGTVNKIGATACHLHWGVKDPAGVEVDGWPLLIQNGATEDDVLLKGTFVQHIKNRSATTNGVANWRNGVTPDAASPVLKQFPAGTVCFPVVQVTGGAVGTVATWFGCWLYDDSPAGWAFGYFHASVLGPLSPIEQSGHSDQELKDARAVGISDAAKSAANTQ